MTPARNGMTALVLFVDTYTKKDFTTCSREYWQFCFVHKTDRKGLIKEVLTKSGTIKSVIFERLVISQKQPINIIHHLGGEKFNTVEDAKLAVKKIKDAYTDHGHVGGD